MSLSFFACGWRGGGIAWFLAWRAAAGACGAILMVQAPVLILPAAAPARRGRVGGLIFSGVGLGIVAAATVVPMLLAQGLAATWIALGAICSIMTAASWRFWGRAATPAPAPARALSLPSLRLPAPVLLLLIAYTLNAIGYLPHTLFWADFIHSELHRPLAQAGFFWACFGAGAACGPYLTGVAADRLGLGPTLLAGFSLKALGVALPLFARGDLALVLSSVLVGFFSPGIVGAASSYALELGGAGHAPAPLDRHERRLFAGPGGWGQPDGGLMAGRASYAILFVIASLSLLAASGASA